MSKLDEVLQELSWDSVTNTFREDHLARAKAKQDIQELVIDVIYANPGFFDSRLAMLSLQQKVEEL